MNDSAEKGYINCLKYLHENGCSWDTFTCSFAARNGHLDCLKYAIENNCIYDKQQCINSAGNREEIINYLSSI